MSKNPKLDLPAKPEGKYSDWCEFKGMPPWDHHDSLIALREAKQMGLSDKELAAYVSHKHMNTSGLEFEMQGNLRLKNHHTFENGLIIVPCFLPEAAGPLANKFVQETFEMQQKSLFKYDCWMPIENWDKENIRNSVLKIDELMSCLSFLSFTHFSWKPKYHYDQVTQEGLKYSTQLSEHNLEKIQRLYHSIENLPINDRNAILNSIGWFSQAFRQTDNSSRFLFFMFSIESLVTYIENKIEKESPFFKFKTGSAMDTKQKESCIEEILASETNKIESITKAFHDCIERSITKTMKEHLSNVFSDKPEWIELLFKDKSGKKSLYSLRSSIAHGSLNSLSPEESKLIQENIWNIQKIAFNYIAKILT